LGHDRFSSDSLLERSMPAPPAGCRPATTVAREAYPEPGRCLTVSTRPAPVRRGGRGAAGRPRRGGHPAPPRSVQRTPPLRTVTGREHSTHFHRSSTRTFPEIFSACEKMEVWHYRTCRTLP